MRIFLSTARPPSPLATRVEISPSHHPLRQCKIFASSVNFSVSLIFCVYITKTVEVRWNWQCQSFGLKIWQCKILDKSHVCWWPGGIGEIPSHRHPQGPSYHLEVRGVATLKIIAIENESFIFFALLLPCADFHTSSTAAMPLGSTPKC